MTTDPKKSLSSAAISELAKSDVDQLLQTGLADFSLRELLGLLISSAGAAERNVYLEKQPGDKPNGFYDRSLQMGTIRVIAAVIAKKSSRCCWESSVPAARSMPLKTHSRRWA